MMHGVRVHQIFSPSYVDLQSRAEIRIGTDYHVGTYIHMVYDTGESGRLQLSPIAKASTHSLLGGCFNLRQAGRGAGAASIHKLHAVTASILLCRFQLTVNNRPQSLNME